MSACSHRKWYAPLIQKLRADTFECARKLWTYHGVPSMQRSVFWTGNRAVVAWRQACAERTVFLERVVDKLGDLEARAHPAQVCDRHALRRVRGFEAASDRPAGRANVRQSRACVDIFADVRGAWVKLIL